ncbi:C-X-C chemokine receptor type 1 [Hoplias malabaricus]|uniref:C-X-C chemokine receptor type 1 n=1 Tax=Hoplias malabaricus TaxID=27720 RepID=UPI003462B729
MDDPNTSRDLREIFELLQAEFNDSLINSTFTLNPMTIPCEAVAISDTINIGMCVFYTVVFLLAIPGNLIVWLMIGLNRQSLSSSDVYLFHLMLADMLLALVLPFYAISMVNGWLFGDFMCKLVSLVREANFYTSILFLACISVDRYMVIVKALETQKAQRRLCSCAVCVGIWFLGFLFSLPSLYHEAFTQKYGEPIVCAERFKMDEADEWRLATRIMRHVLGFFLPLVIMLICYSITIARLLRTRSSCPRKKAMRVIVVVVVAFLLCWTPFHVATIVDTLLRVKLLENSCARRNVVDIVMFAMQSLGLLHCCVNPVVYAFVGRKFRERFLQILQKKGLLKNSHHVQLAVLRASRSSPQSSEATSNFL